MKIKAFTLIVTLLAVILAGYGVSTVSAQTVCSPATSISVPFAKDGAGTFCYVATSLCSYVNSWNTTTVSINGVNATNLYVASSSIAPLNGVYTITYNGGFAWSHFEIAGTCGSGPTNTPIAVSTATRTSTQPAGPTATLTRTVTQPIGPTATRTRTPTTGPTVTLTRTATLPAGFTNTPSRTPTSGGLVQKAFRVFWVRPTDVAYDQNIVTGINNVMLEAQRFYQQELGVTFTFNPVEVLNGVHTASWYSTNPNGSDPYWYTASNLRDEIKQQTGIVENDSRWKVVGYISAEGNGGASHQWVFLPKHDTDGAAGYRPEGMGRWYGGMVHELGHALGLPDATSTDGTPMSASFYDYPNCHFTAAQKNTLLTISQNSGYWH